MKRIYKYRLYANDATISKAESWLSVCRELYNAALLERIYYYRSKHSLLTYVEQQNEMPEAKKLIPELRQVDAQVLLDVLRRLDLTFRGFFRRIRHGDKGGFPRFRGMNRYDSFSLKQNSWKLDGRYLRISKVGSFKLRLSRPIQGNIKTITIRRALTGKWYAFFSCDNIPEHELVKSGKVVGLDVGISSFLVDSDGNKVNNPKFFIHAQKKLRRLNRRMGRRVKGSIRRNKARILVAKHYEKITNQRQDFLHKLANKYVKDNGVIVVEDATVGNLIKNRCLSKAIIDSSWGQFFHLLSYKAEEAGGVFIRVPPYNTSQNCSRCGQKVEKTLAERTHKCPYCGLVMDRDENAARNILALGQSVQALTKQDTVCVA